MARFRVEEIQNRIRDKVENGVRCFTPEEFKDFLIFKGLARSVPRFLLEYSGIREVENITTSIFETNLFVREFQETEDAVSRNDILRSIENGFHALQRIQFVGPGVASACLSLCFPKLCATADYIVPALFHNERDQLGNINPLFQNNRTRQRITEALRLPLGNGLTPSETRNIAFLHYVDYIQEVWNIKRIFALMESVRKIEEAFWSFGICYVKKESENFPLIFRNEPSPPKSGLFSKFCPN